MALELMIQSTRFSTPIEWNYEQLKTEMEQRVSVYKDIVYTEDSIPAAKDDKALLNNVRTQIESTRKQIKAEVNKDYMVFEAQIKAVLALLDSGIYNISTQIDKYESDRVLTKRKQCEDIYNEIFPDELKALLVFDEIFIEKWTNKTVPLSQVRKDIEQVINIVKTGIETIKRLESIYEPTLINTFLCTLEMKDVYENERQLKESAAKLAASERIAPQIESKRRVASNQPQEVTIEATPQIGRVFSLSFKVTGTEEQLTALSTYLKQNHINYERIQS